MYNLLADDDQVVVRPILKEYDGDSGTSGVDDSPKSNSKTLMNRSPGVYDTRVSPDSRSARSTVGKSNSSEDGVSWSSSSSKSSINGGRSSEEISGRDSGVGDRSCTSVRSQGALSFLGVGIASSGTSSIQGRG